MIVLKANTEQYEALEGYENRGNQLRFAQDAGGNKIVGLNVLSVPAFSEIHDQLDALERIEFEPATEELYE